MQWCSELFDTCYMLGFKEEGVKPPQTATQDQVDFIYQVLLTKENFTFSELEKIKEDSIDNIWIEILEDGIREHTKYSIIMGIIKYFEAGRKFKNKTQK